MNQALAMYSRIDATNFEDIQQSVIEVKNHLDLLAQVYTISTAGPTSQENRRRSWRA